MSTESIDRYKRYIEGIEDDKLVKSIMLYTNFTEDEVTTLFPTSAEQRSALLDILKLRKIPKEALKQFDKTDKSLELTFNQKQIVKKEEGRQKKLKETAEKRKSEIIESSISQTGADVTKEDIKKALDAIGDLSDFDDEDEDD